MSRNLPKLMSGVDDATASLVRDALLAVGESPVVRAPRAETHVALRPDLRTFPDMAAARAGFERDPDRCVVLVTDGAVLMRRRSFPVDVYVLALVGPDRRVDGSIEADDFVRKPIDPVDLSGRLVAAAVDGLE